MARTLMAHSPWLTGTNTMVHTGSTLDGWNYPWQELIFMVPSLLKPLKFYYNLKLCTRYRDIEDVLEDI